MRLALLAVVVVVGAATAAAQPPSATTPTATTPIETTPTETVPRVGRFSIGGGVYSFDGPLRGAVVQTSLGARVTERTWIVATYSILIAVDDEFYELDRFGEGSLALGRMLCRGNVCLAGNAGVGYQRAGKTVLQDDFDTTIPPIVYDLDNVFLEARLAARLNLSYVWLEGSLAFRDHVYLDADGAQQRSQIGAVLGVAIYVTP